MVVPAENGWRLDGDVPQSERVAFPRRDRAEARARELLDTCDEGGEVIVRDLYHRVTAISRVKHASGA